MDPLLIGGIGLGALLLFGNKKKKKPASPLPGGDSSGGSGQTPRGPVDPSAPPTGPFDPFDLPTIDPPPQGSGGSGSGGDSGGNSGGGGRPTDDPAPTPVPPGTTLKDIGPYALGVTQDCQEIFEGERWYAEVFLPAAVRLVQYDGPTFNHPYILMRALLLTATDASCPPDAPDCNLEPGCFLNWTYFLGPLLDVPGGDWDSETHEGYAAFLAYSDWYALNYAAADGFLQSVESRLWASDLAAHFNQHVDTDIVFVPPGQAG